MHGAPIRAGGALTVERATVRNRRPQAHGRHGDRRCRRMVRTSAASRSSHVAIGIVSTIRSWPASHASSNQVMSATASSSGSRQPLLEREALPRAEAACVALVEALQRKDAAATSGVRLSGQRPAARRNSTPRSALRLGSTASTASIRRSPRLTKGLDAFIGRSVGLPAGAERGGR